MVRKVLKAAFLSDGSLDGEGKSSNHSQASVLDLLDLELGKDLGVVSESQGVEGTTGVELISTIKDGGIELADTGGESSRAGTSSTETLNGTHQDDVDGNDTSEGKRVGDVNPRDSKVVEGLSSSHGTDSLEPSGTLNISTVGSEAFGDDGTSGGKHSPASVDQLSLAVLVNTTVLTEAEGIVSVTVEEEEKYRLVFFRAKSGRS
jgi:hypothetical protein